MRKLLNISIDDVTPHPMSSLNVVKRCERVLAEFRDAKFTFFIPTSYWRTVGLTMTKEPLSIDKFTDFCEKLRLLPSTSYEICYHGYHHGIPTISNNDELQSINYDEALDVIARMINVANNAGLGDVFKPIIRPPAWRMSAASFDACEKLGIHTFALSPDEYAMKTYGDAHKNRRVVFYNCCPPSKPLKLFDKIEIVYHACEWDANYFSDDMCDQLLKFLRENNDSIKFSFIEDLVDG